ncbi:ABC transporter permease [Streptomyces sp. NBC_00879]|uniref:ABC transporter permease n=1 Tax=Streptomyces sp. NBC_00879 TaxID=2975855 RepID=UPI0038670FCE
MTVLVLGVAALAALKARAQGPQRIDLLVNFSHAGFAVAQLAVVVLAATVIGSEYGTGSIRTSLAAVPWRVRWLAAKTVTVAGLVLVTGSALSIASFALVHLSVPEVSGSVRDPGVIRAVLGAGLYLSGLAVLSLAVTAALRSTVGGIVTVFALIFVLPGVVALSPLSGAERFLPGGLLPPNAGWSITQVDPSQLGGLPPWTGFAVLCAWAAAALAGAGYLLVRRDA